MKRRSFLSFLGVGVAAAPLAAQQAAQHTLAQAGMGSSVLSAAAMDGPEPCAPAELVRGQPGALFRWVKLYGIPEWKMAELRIRAEHRRRHGIDIDLASLRSVSPQFKAIRQRQRNLQREINNSLSMLSARGAQRSFWERFSKKFSDGHHDWYD